MLEHINLIGKCTNYAPSHKAKLYLEGIAAKTVQTFGLQVVEDPADADNALLRLKTPYEPRPGGFESLFHK